MIPEKTEITINEEMLTSSMPEKPKRRVFPPHELLMVGLLLLSFYLSAVVSDRVFERLPHLEDELAYQFQARTLARGDLVIESPEMRRAFWQPFVIDRQIQTGSDEPVDSTYHRFGKYSPGWPALLTVGVLWGETWLINALFAVLTVALVYRLGGEIFNKDVGLIAAVLTTFSPMALLLNGTLMGHTSALFGVMLFMYAYWRIEKRRKPLLWGGVAGLALGMVMANRPLTAVGVALPFIAWSLARLLREIARRDALGFARVLRPLVLIGVLGIILSLSIPLYSYAAVRDPSENLYTYVWEYDRIGFGECCGRSRDHNLERAIRHARFDLSLTAADLFGWTVDLREGRSPFPEFTAELQDHLRTEGDYFPLTGISWALLPFGIGVGFRRKSPWILIWLVIGIAWILFPLKYNNAELTRSHDFSYLWLIVLMIWVAVPLFVMALTDQPSRMAWTWLLVGVAVGIIGMQTTYWIGSQRYSTRYYFEMLAALSLLTALPLAQIARHFSRWLVYGLVALLIAYSLHFYSIPRISALHGFNNITRAYIEAMETRRDGNRPVLILVEGDDVRWRAYGSFMALTNPYLDSDVVAAWNFGDADTRDQLIAMFPDRQVIEMQAEQSTAWFKDENRAG
jgi:4-amino-4-deoxy-L-arabinose transferase-like glycosyltransferase